MRRAALVLGLLILLPSALAALPTDPKPMTHVVLDRTAYRAQVDLAMAFVRTYQHADGGIYEYPNFLTNHDAAHALRLLAAAGTVDVVANTTYARHLAFVLSRQSANGAWGEGGDVPETTAVTMDALLDSGIDPNATAIQRGLAYIRLGQGVNGAWSDGAFAASHQTAEYVEILLRTGAPRNDPQVQSGVQFILGLQNASNGGFAPAAGWFETEAATADVIHGLDAYLRAPTPSTLPPESVTVAQVQASVDAALGYLGSQLDPATGLWGYNIGYNAQIVGAPAAYYEARGLPTPLWLGDAESALLSYQAPDGGLWNNPQHQAEILDWTADAFAGLAHAPRALAATDALRLQATVNAQGAFQSSPVTLTLKDASGAVVASSSTTTGVSTISWSGLAPGKYDLTASAPGASSTTVSVWR